MKFLTLYNENTNSNEMNSKGRKIGALVGGRNSGVSFGFKLEPFLLPCLKFVSKDLFFASVFEFPSL
jgi:hypothetical protein